MIIYKIEFPHGKNYIGLTTTSLEQRLKEHKYCAKKGDTNCLYNALRKYNMIDTFELIQIDTADTIEELCEKEMKYILQYNSYYQNEQGYNMTYGGEGTNGYVFTETDKQKMSESATKYFQNRDSDTIQKKKELHKQIYEDNPELREKCSISQKKRFEDNPTAGKEHSDKLKKYYNNPEAKEKCSLSQKKRFENPEAREEMSKIKKQYYEEHPEIAKEHGEKMKKYYEEHPEAGEKISETMKQYYIDHPEVKQQLNLIQQQHWEKEENRQKQSETLTNYHKKHPEAAQERSVRMKKWYKNNPELLIEMSNIAKKNYKENPQRKKNILDAKGQNKLFDIFKNGEFIKTFTYQMEAREFLQKEYNITTDIKISEVLSGTRKSSAGFIFKYKL